ncbi:MAG: hypothetical protein ACPLPR_04745 [Bacillota bacterium]
MKVRLAVYGHSQQYLPGHFPVEVDLDGPRSVEEILDMLGINQQLVMGVFSKGQRRSKAYVPEDGEEIVLVSPPAGG